LQRHLHKASILGVLECATKSAARVPFKTAEMSLPIALTDLANRLGAIQGAALKDTHSACIVMGASNSSN
jgi:hypothetical protein